MTFVVTAGCVGLALLCFVSGFTVIGAVLALVGLVLYFKGGPSKIVDPKGKAVFITGCDRGFGNSLCQRLDKLGYTVFAGCLFSDREGATDLRKACSDRLHVVQIDVTDDWQVRGAVKYVKEHLGDNVLWAVVNNAGIGLYIEIEWCSVQQFQKIMDVNTFGVVRVTKAFLPLVRNGPGRIVNVASLAGRFTFPAFAAYSMSKRACIAFSDALRREMMKFGVHVVTIEPGLYKTAISETKYLEEQSRRSWTETPTEVKEAYGEEYFDAFIGNIEHQMRRAKPNINEVVDLMELSVIEEKPRIRYVPASSVIRAGIMSSLPAGLLDKIFQNYLPKFKSPSESSSVSGSGSVSARSRTETSSGSGGEHGNGNGENTDQAADEPDHGDVFRD